MTIGVTVGLGVGVTCGATAGIAENGTVAATLDTTTLSGDTPGVLTNGTKWTATLTWQTLGTGGNSGVLDVHTDTGAAAVEVRDGQRFLGSWAAAANTVGVLVQCDVGDPVTIGAIEVAINATSALAQVTTADPAPTKEIDIGVMDATTCSGTFSGGL